MCRATASCATRSGSSRAPWSRSVGARSPYGPCRTSWRGGIGRRPDRSHCGVALNVRSATGFTVGRADRRTPMQTPGAGRGVTRTPGPCHGPRVGGAIVGAAVALVAFSGCRRAAVARTERADRYLRRPARAAPRGPRPRLNQPRSAAERVEQALALDPDDVDAWALLVASVPSSRTVAGPQAGRGRPRGAGGNRGGRAVDSGRAPGSPSSGATLLGRWTRDRTARPMTWRARGPGCGRRSRPAPTLWTPPRPCSIGRRVTEACAVGPRALARRGDLYRAEQVLQGCLEAGPPSPGLLRAAGDLAWAIRDTAAAAGHWSAAGTGCAVSVGRAGLPGWAAQAARCSGASTSRPTTGGRPGRVAGGRAGGRASVARGRSALLAPARGIPIARTAQAAAALWAGAAGEAVEIVAETDSAASLAIRARALARWGAVRRPTTASEPEALPANPHLWRLLA